MLVRERECVSARLVERMEEKRKAKRGGWQTPLMCKRVIRSPDTCEKMSHQDHTSHQLQ